MSNKRAFRVVEKAPKLKRPIGTSVQFVSYIPKEEHLRFMRHHDRNTGTLEKLGNQYSWLQIIGGLSAGAILAFGLFCLFA